jgi:energy-coupling factor transporter ATP-binding protein EcfA2
LTLQEAEMAFAPTITASRSVSRQEEQSSDTLHETPTTQTVAARATDIWYNYPDGTTALKGVNLTLRQGEMLALLGPNGSGKTTLARILAGIYQLTRGQLEVQGRAVRSHRERARLPSAVGYVFQNPDHQLFSRSVRAEILSGLKNIGLPANKRQEIAERTIAAVGLTELANEDPLFLSKGQRQRLAVAAILAMGPDILIVDEPTTGQDARSIAAIMQLLRELQEQGKTILIITHDMTLVAEHCQRVVAFRDGQVSFTGTPAQLFANEELLAKTGLQSPISARLSNYLHTRYPDLPELLTVEQWSAFLQQPPIAKAM